MTIARRFRPRRLQFYSVVNAQTPLQKAALPSVFKVVNRVTLEPNSMAGRMTWTALNVVGVAVNRDLRKDSISCCGRTYEER